MIRISKSSPHSQLLELLQSSSVNTDHQPGYLGLKFVRYFVFSLFSPWAENPSSAISTLRNLQNFEVQNFATSKLTSPTSSCRSLFCIVCDNYLNPGESFQTEQFKGSLFKHNELQKLTFKHPQGEPNKAEKVMIWISKSSPHSQLLELLQSCSVNSNHQPGYLGLKFVRYFVFSLFSPWAEKNLLRLSSTLRNLQNFEVQNFATSKTTSPTSSCRPLFCIVCDNYLNPGESFQTEQFKGSFVSSNMLQS